MLVTKLRSQARNLFLYFIFILLLFERASSAVNITVAVIMERSPTDMPFGINRTIGVINNAIDKSKKIVNQSINLDFIIRYTDVPTCTYFQFGALAAEIYYNSESEINAIIGPGKENNTFNVIYDFQRNSHKRGCENNKNTIPLRSIPLISFISVIYDP